MCLQYTVSQHGGSVGGPSVFPERQKGPRFSLMKPESADVKQHEDLLNVRCCSPRSIFDFSSVFICCWLLSLPCTTQENIQKCSTAGQDYCLLLGNVRALPNADGGKLSHSSNFSFTSSLITLFELQMLSRLTNYPLILCHEYLK